jgi:hypothetical protein
MLGFPLVGVLLPEYPFLVGENSLLVGNHSVQFLLVRKYCLLVGNYCRLVRQGLIQLCLIRFDLFLVLKNGLLVGDDSLLVSQYFVTRHSLLLRFLDSQTGSGSPRLPLGGTDFMA